MIKQEKLQHITKLKNNQTVIQRLFSFDEKIQKNINDCGRYIQFTTRRSNVTNQIKRAIEQATTCKYRYCPLCNYYRIVSVAPQMQKALEIEQSKGNKILFLTLTVPNCQYSTLRETLARMNYSYSKLVKLPLFIDCIEAWIRTTEITFNTKGEAHPHFHIALSVNSNYFKKGNYKTTREWSQIWSKAYKIDKQLIVDIRKAYKSEKHSKRDLDIQSTVKELAKYCIKSTDLKRVKTPENMEIIYSQLKGLRFIATSQNIKLSEADKDKLNPQEWELIESIIMKYYPDMKKYIEYRRIEKD